MTPTLISIVVFFCVFGLCLALGGLWFVYQHSAGAITQRRLREMTEGTNKQHGTASIVKNRPDLPDSDRDNRSLLENLQCWILQAGMDVSATQLLILTTGLSTAAAVVVFVTTRNPVLAALAFATFLPAPIFVVLIKRNKRAKDFETQLPQALELMARSLRAGHSFASSMKMVADEMPDPIAIEFGATYQEQELGIPLETCLNHLTERVNCNDLRFFALAVMIQRETGGDLAEVLDKSGYVIRERFRILGQVQALTAEGRLSGWVLTALPPAMFVVINALNPEYARLLIESHMGNLMLVFAGIMQILGMIAIHKIVAIKV